MVWGLRPRRPGIRPLTALTATATAVPGGGLALLVAGSPCCHGTLWGGLPSLSPAYPAFSLLSRPHPPTPPSQREGGIFSFFMQGASPLASPGLGGARHWLGERWRRPAGGLPSLSPAYPAFSLFVCPHPPYPLPGGKGGFLVFLCKGLRPLHPRGLDGARHWLGGSWRRPVGGVPSWSPADAAFSFCFCPLPRDRISGGQIRQAPEKKCRLIKIPRGGHTDATAQRGDSRLSCRQCLPRRNRNRVREQKKHRRNRGN